jgi:hypothetical protein
MPRRIAVFLLLAVFAFAPARAQVIPPGQEELLGAMLGKGAPLPDGCALTDGVIDGDAVRATYHCAYGDVVLQLSHSSTRTPQSMVTKQFALTVLSGSPRHDLLAAIEALIRARESEFEWSMLSVGRHSRGFFGIPASVFALLLLGLALASALGAWRARAGPPSVARVLEALIVAAVVVIWLQIRAGPPAHADTGVDVALARDCIASGGASCLGHAASAIGLVQGQAFTYALAIWLYLGLSMQALCFVAACVLGAATGLLHHGIGRRFGAAGWIASALAASLGVYMTGYPTLWNPSWFVLPLTIAFFATLATADDGGTSSAFVAGTAFALTAESHLLFGTFVAVAVVIVLITAERAAAAVAVLVASFVLTEVVVSPISATMNSLVLRQWVGAHRLPVALVALLFAASVPIQLRLRQVIRRRPDLRESVAVALWLSAGAVGIGLVLPWAVSRPAQVRYYGAAFPAIPYAVGWLLDRATLRTRSWAVRALAIAIFVALFVQRITTANFAGSAWFMDDGRKLAVSAGLVDASALDIQLLVRPVPSGALNQVAAAFVGTADVPAFPSRIVRAVRAQEGTDPPAGWARVALARGEMFTSEIAAWTHPEEAEICPDPPVGEPCMTLTRDDFAAVARSAGGAVHRVFGLRIARSATRIREWAGHGARSLLWKIPLHAVDHDTTREIVFSDAADERIVAVDGTRWTPRGDDRAAVERPAPAATASITVRTTLADKFEAGLPPMPLELRETEVGVLRVQ